MDSVMDMFRQEIIGQELIFRSQVRELHRLYWTQNNMMNEFRKIGMKAQTSEVKNILSEPSLDRKGVNVGALLQHHSRIFGLQFPAYDFIISGIETELSKSNRTLGTGCGIEVIELEDSVETEYHEEDVICATEFRTPVPETLTLFGSEMGNNKHCMLPMVHLEVEQDRMFREHASSVGLGDDHTLAAVDNLSSNKHVCRPLLIDLNIPNEDECYDVQINDHLLKTGSPSMNFSIGHHQVLDLDPTKSFTIPFTHKRDSANHVSITSSTYDKDIVNLSQAISRDSADKPRNLEGSGEDVLSSHHSTAEATQSCAVYTSNGMINNSECSSYEKSTEEPATLSTNDDSVITQLHSPKHEISCNAKFKDGGRDFVIAAAAEVLVNISSGRSELLENSTEAEEFQCAEPQSSSDSFEFMAMQLSEVENEEHVLKGETPSMNETQKGENGLRLRRGRRLRDFRKEILPGLVSLSRHEICEDLYSIGYSLRKNTLRSARRSWFLPTRRRRRF